MVRVEELHSAPDLDFARRYRAVSGPERTFLVDGHVWTVREAVDPVTRTRSLIFSTDGLARRVRKYPPNWRELSSDELRALSWST